MGYFKIERDDNGIASVLMDDPDKSVNVMNDAFINGLENTLDEITADDTIRGIVLTSGKETFFAGGDLKEILELDDSNTQDYKAKVNRIKATLTRLESCGKPVVAAINGAALGGGYEICLATHRRILLSQPKVAVGLPEVTLGLLPGAGGVVRLVRLLGLQTALPYLMEGRKARPEEALAKGLVDELVTTREELLEKARDWILNHPATSQPWHRRGFEFPGGSPETPANRDFIVEQTARLQAKQRGLYPAPQAILSIAVESMHCGFESAQKVETRYFLEVARSQVAKNMITTFFQTNKLLAGESRPKGFDKTRIAKLGILGAGMMGSGIAYAAAKVGLPVVLKDVSREAAERGKAYSDKVTQRLIARGDMSEAQAQQLLERIHTTDRANDLEGCDLIIEAVFENRDLKAQVTREAVAFQDGGALFASNTSSLPITGLAQAHPSPEHFIGLHFFSPVDRMPLVEIICGKQTSEATLARAYDFVRQIGKTPIVVNDSRDFYTSRVYESFCDEGAWLLEDSVEPALIENAAQQAGMPVGPLASVDEVSQKLVHSVKSMAKKDAEETGSTYPKAEEPPFRWIERMVVELQRSGRAYGGGYYEYPENDRKYLWPRLKELQPTSNQEVSLQDIKDRILFRQCIEAVRCLEEGVLRSVIDCNIGSMLGIGFPTYTGGQLQFINAYGLAAFVERAEQLADAYGERFRPPQLLRLHAADNKPFA